MSLKSKTKNTRKYKIFSLFLNDYEKYINLDNIISQNIQKNCTITHKNNSQIYNKLHSKIFEIEEKNTNLLNENNKVNKDYSINLLDCIEKFGKNTVSINNIPKYEYCLKKPFILTTINKETKINTSTNNKLFFINKQGRFKLDNNEIINQNEFKKDDENFIFEAKNEMSELNPIENNLEEIKNNIFNKYPLYRQDYYVKQFKVRYSIWLRNILNNKLKILIKETNSIRKHLKFYPLNSLQFTANPKYEDNKYFLSLKIKDILIVGINCIKSSNQKKNKENMDIIYRMYQEYKGKIDERKCDLLSFLYLTMEDSIKIFYDEEEFKNFKNSKTIIYFDQKFYQEKNFSLLEKYGFIELIKNYKGNAKSNNTSFCCRKVSL